MFECLGISEAMACQKGAVVATLEMNLSETAPVDKDWIESARVLLFKSMFTNLCGVTAGDWFTILGRHGTSISPRQWHRAAVVSLGSVLNSWYKWREDRAFGAQLAEVQIQPPVFILGHWRSGTTHLHNLLALDPRCAFPNLYEVFFPHTFLGTEDSRNGMVSSLVPQTRIFDNVAQGFDLPNEDEFATAAMSLCSPYMSWTFPRATKFYEAFLTFRGVPESQRLRWEESLIAFLKKLTLRYQRPLLLKSPPHTGRLGILSRMFPDAKFIHIHRDPYTIYQSTMHLNRVFTGCLQFQDADPDDLEPGVLRRYQMMHDAYFDERDAIPESRIHEMAFHDLERDPIGQVRGIYEQLALPGFDELQPRLERYVDSLASYRKNRYAPLDAETKRRVHDSWHRSFEAWDYPVD